MAHGSDGRGLMGPFLVVNCVVLLIVIGLAGWCLDKYIDGEQDHPHWLGYSLRLHNKELLASIKTEQSA
ncbi:Membrane protein PM19L-like protein [Drosera capensis]